MSGKRYTEEFKIEAVKQVTDRGYPVADVAERLGISQQRMYQWVKQFSVTETQRADARNQQDEIRRLKSELRRVTEERDILKKAAA